MQLLLTEHEDGRFRPITAELLVFARRLAALRKAPVAALLLGSDLARLERELIDTGVDRVFTVDDPLLDAYDPDVCLAALDLVIQKSGPFMVAAGHGGLGSDLLPRLAVRTGRPFVAGCVDFEIQTDRLLLTREIFNAKLNMKVVPSGEPPYFVTIAPGAFPPATTADNGSPSLETGTRESNATAEVVRLDLDEIRENIQIRQQVLGRDLVDKGRVDFDSASTIVAGGRGLKGKENVHLIEELADALGAAVGASRPVVDAEWLPREHQIGSSGQSVSPKLYFAIGISGAIQHLVGMQTSQCIVAINTDADAPIFKVAHYGIVGDLFEVVPEITKIVNELGTGQTRTE